MRKPKVSIVIPVYNVENYLRECLDSTAGQTLREIEIICVNDGSTDSSPAILEEYAAKDSRFVIVHQENAGVSAARNRGMDLAKGEYLLFLDSDDVAEPCLAQAAVEAMEEQGLDLLHFDAEVFFENGIMSAHKGARQYHAHTVGMQEPTDGMQALAFCGKKTLFVFASINICSDGNGLSGTRSALSKGSCMKMFLLPSSVFYAHSGFSK